MKPTIFTMVELCDRYRKHEKSVVRSLDMGISSTGSATFQQSTLPCQPGWLDTPYPTKNYRNFMSTWTDIAHINNYRIDTTPHQIATIILHDEELLFLRESRETLMPGKSINASLNSFAEWPLQTITNVVVLVDRKRWKMVDDIHLVINKWIPSDNGRDASP